MSGVTLCPIGHAMNRPPVATDRPRRGPSLKTHCWKDVSHEVATFLALARNLLP